MVSENFAIYSIYQKQIREKEKTGDRNNSLPNKKKNQKKLIVRSLNTSEDTALNKISMDFPTGKECKLQKTSAINA